MFANPPLDESDEMRPALAKIFSLSARDAPWLAALHGDGFSPSWSGESFASLLDLSTTYGWGLRYGLKPFGFLLLSIGAQEAEILTFQIAAAYQGQGYGKKLLRYGLNRAYSQGASQVYLDVAPSRAAAQNIYRDLGFVVTGRRVGYYKTPNGREDALLMSLKLSANIFSKSA